MATEDVDEGKDPRWKYSFLADKKNKNSVTCKLCRKVTNGGINRQKHHLAGGNRNVKKCLQVPPEVRDEMRTYMAEKLEKKAYYDKPWDYDNMIATNDDDEDAKVTIGKKSRGK